MALQFQTDVKTRDGFIIQNAYGRVSVTDSYPGTMVSGHVDIYVTEAAWLEGDNAVKTRFIQDCGVPYDRDTMGVDILNIAHDGLIVELGKQGVVASKVL